MAYASPSQIRAPYTTTRPGVGVNAGPARVAAGIGLPMIPRDAFREKAERKAKQRAEKEARRKGVVLPVAATEDAPRAPAAMANQGVKPRPRFTVHVNPNPGQNPKIRREASPPLLTLASATTAPPAPKPSGVKAPPVDRVTKPPRGGGGGGGGGSPPLNVDKEKIVDRDLLMGGLISGALLLFLGWNMFGGKGTAPTAPVSPEPPLQVAIAPVPAPDPFPSLAPVELRPQEPLPPATPAAEPTREAALPAAPEVKTAQAPPAKPVPAVSACERVKMVQAYFCTASATLTPGMRSVLEKQLTDWKACLGGEALVIKGYADTRGRSDFNASLSTRRASTLRDFLKTHDIKVSEAKGEGELAGLDDNQNCANQRRVDVSIGETKPSTACAKPKDAPVLNCGALAPAAPASLPPAK